MIAIILHMKQGGKDMKNKIWKFGVPFLLISFIVSVLGAMFTREPIWLTLFLSACLLYVTYLYVITTRRTMWHQALLEVNKDYRSEGMRDAVKDLWDFQRDCKNEVKKEEETKDEKELEEKIKDRLKEKFFKGLDKDEKWELDVKRRMVKHFYLHLAVLYKYEILTKAIISDIFPKENRGIIEKIIIPIEQATQDYIDQKSGIRPGRNLEMEDLLIKLYKTS